MLYAIFAAGGEQHRVKKGDTIILNKIEQEAGSEIKFDQILMVQDGEKSTIGTPVVPGTVVAEIVSHGRGEKIKVFKFKRRQNYQRTIGHRDWQTVVKIKDIVVN